MMKSNLIDLVDEDSRKIIENQGNILFFDGHNLAYKNVFTSIHFHPEDNEKYNFWKHLMMNCIFANIKKFKPDKLIMAFDDRGSWRKDIFSGYKENRKKMRDGAIVDFEKFFPVLAEFIEDIKQTFTNIYTIKIPRTEADDIIAILTQKRFVSNNEIIIISSDRDLNQLTTNSNVKQYDLASDSFIVSINPSKDLQIKIISGDRSDNIPPIKPSIGKKRAETVISEGVRNWIDTLETEEERKKVQKNFERNKKLIDFSEIPNEIESKIINTYDTYKISPIVGSKLMNFFGKNRLAKQMEDWQNNSVLIKKLN